MLSLFKVFLYANLFTVASANLFRGGADNTRIIGGTEVSGTICVLSRGHADDVLPFA